MEYIFPKENFLTVSDHAASLDIEVESLTLEGAYYRVTTNQPFPEDQLEHLGLEVV